MSLPQPRMITQSANAKATGEWTIIFLKEGITALIGECVQLLYVM
jgi:hypothetical protein